MAPARTATCSMAPVAAGAAAPLYVVGVTEAVVLMGATDLEEDVVIDEEDQPCHMLVVVETGATVVDAHGAH